MICHVSTGSSLSVLSALWDVLQCCPGQDSSLRRRKASAAEEGDAAEDDGRGCGWARWCCKPNGGTSILTDYVMNRDK